MTENPLKREVRLYYLGGLSNGEVAFVQSRGRAFQTPPVGGHIVVPRYYAEDLIQRSHNGVHSAWSMSKRDAEMAMAGQLPHQITGPVVSVDSLSIEELEAVLAERKAATESVEEPEEKDVAPDEPETKAADTEETPSETPDEEEKKTTRRRSTTKKDEAE